MGNSQRPGQQLQAALIRHGTFYELGESVGADGARFTRRVNESFSSVLGAGAPYRPDDSAQCCLKEWPCGSYDGRRVWPRRAYASYEHRDSRLLGQLPGGLIPVSHNQRLFGLERLDRYLRG